MAEFKGLGFHYIALRRFPLRQTPGVTPNLARKRGEKRQDFFQPAQPRLEPGEVKEIYALAGPIPPPPTFALFADAPTPQACFLAQAGQAKAAIVIGCDSGPFYRWVAGEVQRYLRELTARS